MTTKAKGGLISMSSRNQYVAQWENEGFGAVVSNFRAKGGVRVPDFTEQVKLGAQFLDERMPDWWKFIDTSSLDLRNENMCILGQSWSHYQLGELVSSDGRAAGRGRLGSNFQNLMDRFFGTTERDRAAEYGFNLTSYQGRLLNFQAWRNKENSNRYFDVAFEELTATWLTAIRERQERVAYEGSEAIYAKAVASGMTHGAALQEVVKSATASV